MWHYLNEDLEPCTKRTLAIVSELGWRWPAIIHEWMMGWPMQWTARTQLETAKFQSWLQQHGGF